MIFDAWWVFTLFWVVFVITLATNAVNCIKTDRTRGFRQALVGVPAVLAQATLFLRSCIAKTPQRVQRC